MTEGLQALAMQLPPGWLLMLGALVVPFLRGGARQAWCLALPLLGLLQLAAIPMGTSVEAELFSYSLELVRADALARAFGFLFHIAAFLGVLFALKVEDTVQIAASLVYAGSAIAAVFAGDLISLFVCWELTAISSVFLVWATRSEAAYRSGMRYLVIQVGSGVLLLAGAILHFERTGSLAFGPLGLDAPGGLLIFIAFGIKAAFPLLHNWLEDAYPNGTVTGTVFLSVFTTKLAIYALARGFAGTEILIPIGAVMAVFPVFYAAVENDLRRVLAYSLNNQLGFMVVGVGIGTPLALNGAVSHAFAHVSYMSLLFMCMGAVLMRAGTAKATELGGLFRSMPWTAGFCIVGAASISALPLTSGFVTKTMIVSASAKGGLTLAFLALHFGTIGAIHNSGLRVPFEAFFGRGRGDSGGRDGEGGIREAPRHMLLAMGLAAALCLGIGIFPSALYALLPHPVDYEPYTGSHLLEHLQLPAFVALAFAGLVRRGLHPVPRVGLLLDSDWIYRRALPRLRDAIASSWARAQALGSAAFEGAWGRLQTRLERAYRPSSGVFGEPWPTGITTLWAAILLLAYLVLYYGTLEG